MRVEYGLVLIAATALVTFWLRAILAPAPARPPAPARAEGADEPCLKDASLRHRYNDAWLRWYNGGALRDCDADALADVDALFDDVLEARHEWCRLLRVEGLGPTADGKWLTEPLTFPLEQRLWTAWCQDGAWDDPGNPEWRSEDSVL